MNLDIDNTKDTPIISLRCSLNNINTSKASRRLRHSNIGALDRISELTCQVTIVLLTHKICMEFHISNYLLIDLLLHNTASHRNLDMLLGMTLY